MDVWRRMESFLSVTVKGRHGREGMTGHWTDGPTNAQSLYERSERASVAAGERHGVLTGTQQSTAVAQVPETEAKRTAVGSRVRKTAARAGNAPTHGVTVRAGPGTCHSPAAGCPWCRGCPRTGETAVAKRAAGRYQPRRSADWLKLKCRRAQEFVIGGFTEPAGSRVGLGALLLGYYEGRQLRYAGKAGMGYDHRTLLDLRRRLDELATDHSPFATPVRERAPHWAHPRLVAEIEFTEWTRDGMLRHPRFLGLRDDKEPAEVVRERAT